MSELDPLNSFYSQQEDRDAQTYQLRLIAEFLSQNLSGENLQQPSSTKGGLEESWRGTLCL